METKSKPEAALLMARDWALILKGRLSGAHVKDAQVVADTCKEALPELAALLARCADLERALRDLLAAPWAGHPTLEAREARAAARAALSGGGKVGA